MKTMFGRMILFATGLALAAPALAAPKAASGDDTLRRKAYAYAARVVWCATPASRDKLLQTEIGSSAEAKAASKMQALTRQCTSDMPPVSPMLLRNVTASMVYDEEFRRGDPHVPTNAPLPATFAVVPPDRQGTEAQQNLWYVASIANCLTYADPDLSRKLVLADPDAASEEEAFGKLKPALGRCLRPGAAFPISALDFRGVLAEQLLKRSRAVRASRK
jgi:hypothetical protein